MAISIKNKTVLITGAASGIGKIMGRIALEKKAARLIIWDINEAGMEQAASELGSHVICYKVDLSRPDEIEAAATKMISARLIPDIIINNAGIIIGRPFLAHTKEEILKSSAINATAPMLITSWFLPLMKEKGGAVCNIASSAGLVSNPGMSVYVAGKWSLTGWSDSLRLEMKKFGIPVHFTTIMPFYISTGMFEGVRSPLLPILKPETAAGRIIRAIEKSRPMLAMPLPYWFIRLSQGIFPLPVFDWIMEHVFGVYRSMDGFTGRLPHQQHTKNTR